MDRYLQYTRDREPVLTAGFIAAMLLAVADRTLGLTDGDLALWGPVAVVIGSVIMRQLVYSPWSYLTALYSDPPDEDDDPAVPPTL